MVFQSISYFVPRRDEIGWNGIEMMLGWSETERREGEEKSSKLFFFEEVFKSS